MGISILRRQFAIDLVGEFDSISPKSIDESRLNGHSNFARASAEPFNLIHSKIVGQCIFRKQKELPDETKNERARAVTDLARSRRLYGMCWEYDSTVASGCPGPAVESTNVSLATGRFDANVKARSARRWVVEHPLPVLRAMWVKA